MWSHLHDEHTLTLTLTLNLNLILILPSIKTKRVQGQTFWNKKHLEFEFCSDFPVPEEATGDQMKLTVSLKLEDFSAFEHCWKHLR